MATKEELKAKLDELGVDQPAADAKKEELEKAVAEAEGSSSEATKAEVKAEDIIDFPPPVAEREALATGQEVKGDNTLQQSPSGAFHNEPLGSASVPGSRSRLFEQKATFYTDGLSGAADHNHERAYSTPEVLQSNDPVVRTAGDESESEAFKAAKSDKDNRLAEEAKTEDDN
jgi:hypothetical protein